MIPEFPTHVKCEYCSMKKGETVLIPADGSHSMLKYFGMEHGMKTVYNCGQEEANEYYLESLRRVQE